MALNDIINAISEITMRQAAGNLALIFLAASTLIEITPIKVNPISSFLKWVGKKINGDLEKGLSTVAEKVDRNEIDRIRWDILAFANSCRKGELHTKDEFTHIIDLNAKYHEILEEHDMTNGQIDLEYEYIVGIYKHCMEENSFL